MPLAEYNPSEIENKWYKEWLKENIFRANENSKKEPFVIMMPPPNVTGGLHIGHALNMTLQDIVVRYKRMEGLNTLWLPGFDHAGIATQWVVNRELQKQNISRFDLGREKFIEKVWEWVPKTRDTIKKQIEALGASCDWSRQRFTLDEGFARAVREAFSRLYKKGLIYRAPYIVNWDPKDKTAISDLEVEYREERGNLWYIKYPIVDENGEEANEYITVATTRPETMLGDTAVAVNPNDERYKKFIGKKVRLPLAPEKRVSWDGKEVSNLIPVIADDYVDVEFGTGAVKITPAHDPNDFEVGQRHNLPMVIVMDEGAVINDNGGVYKGLDRYEARKKIVEDLKIKGLLEKVEEITHNVGHSQRSGAVVEPYLSIQWFVKTDELSKKAIAVVEQKDIKFIPENWEKTYLNWMYNIKDWCISRQIWWGHRIPVWYCDKCGHTNVFSDDIHDSLAKRVVFNIYADTKISQLFSVKELTNYLHSKNFNQPDKTNLEFYEQVVFGTEIPELKTEKSLTEFLEKNFKKVPILDEQILEGKIKDESKIIGYLPHVIFYMYEHGYIGKSFTALDVLNSYKIHKDEIKNIFKQLLGGKVKREEILFNLDRLEKWLIDHAYGNCKNGRIFFTEKETTIVSTEGKDNIKTEKETTFSVIDDLIKGYKYYLELKCEKCNSSILKQEDDVLDTWFSSGLWPFGTLGWPEDTKDLKTFYPTSLLITGFDIIFFWVARMIMMGTEFMGEKPFSDVYVHALVRDEKGEKMSKTKGNVIDPLEMINKYGADSLRYALAALAAQGRDIRLSEKRIEGYKHFANKIWNASKFVLTNLENHGTGHIIYDVSSLHLSYEDKWILSKLNETINKVKRALMEYRFNDYAQEVYDFFWHNYCDWYIEFTKERIYKGNDEEVRTALSVLIYVLDQSLKLLHPIMPFITEEIWQKLPYQETKYLPLAKFPKYREEFNFDEDKNYIENVKELVVAIRNARADFGIEPSKKLTVYIKPESIEFETVLKSLIPSLKLLAKLESVVISKDLDKPKNSIVVVFSKGEAYLDISGSIDIEKEIERQEKLLKDIGKSITISEKRLSNKNFIEKAPKEVVDRERAKYEEFKQKKDKIAKILENLKALLG